MSDLQLEVAVREKGYGAIVPSMRGTCGMQRLLLLSSWLAIVVSAYSSFDSNCTLPETPTNYVSSPPTRGTMDIVWSAVLALISCTWTIQHLVVPRQTVEEEAVNENRLISILMFPLRYLRNVNWHKVRWMLLTIIFPEFILGKALAEYSSATYWEKRFREIAPPAVPELNHQLTDLTVGKRHKVAVRPGRSDAAWSKSHGFLANMRGMVLRFNVNAVPTSLHPTKPSKEAIEQGLHVPQPDFTIPYHAQDAKKAEMIEAEMCRKICGLPCQNRPLDQDSKDSPSNEQPIPIVSEINEKVADQPISTEGKTQVKDLHAVQLHESPKGQVTSPHVSTKISSELSSVEGHTPEAHDRMVLGPHRSWRGAWALSAAQWFHAYEIGLIEHLPAITKEEIDDRSKGDYLVKVVSVFQIIWLVISIVARAVGGLDISLLEVSVVAFAAMAVVIYLFFLQKPQEVSIPVYVDASITLTRDHVIALASRSAASTIFVHEFWLHGVAVRDQAENIFPISPGLVIHTPFRREPFYINPVLGLGFGGILFGSVHFAAWNFTFPTPVERLLWRISCVLCVALPPLGAVVYYLAISFGQLAGRSDLRTKYILKPMEYLLAPGYLLARCYLAAEMVRQLGYLEPSAFLQVDWTAALPHIG